MTGLEIYALVAPIFLAAVAWAGIYGWIWYDRHHDRAERGRSGK